MGASVDKAGRVRCQGLQVTAQRVVVPRAVSDRAHSAAAEIAPVVRSEIGAVSLQAVYGARATLTGRAIIGGIQTAGSAARYEDRVDNNHHDLIWRSCSQVVDVDCAVGRTSCLTAAENSGHEIDEAEVIDWADVPTASRRLLSRPAGDRVSDRGTCAIRLMRMRGASARADHHRNETVSM